jgi:hypothetical protein
MAVLNNTGIRAGASAAGGDTVKEITNSLRFDAEPNRGYLHRTPGSAGNSEKWTVSFWYKGGDAHATMNILSVGNTASTKTIIYIDGTSSNGGDLRILTNNAEVRRTHRGLGDCTNWYHIVIAVDTAEVAADDRMKIWINGVAITQYETKATIGSGAGNFLMNSNVQHIIGADSSSLSNDWQGWLNCKLADFYILDGLAKEAEDFGFFDADTDRWQPKDYSGSVGAQGVKLDFLDTSSSAALGNDAAGSNDWAIAQGTFFTSNEIGDPSFTTTTYRLNDNSSSSDHYYNNSDAIKTNPYDCGTFSPDRMLWLDLGSAQWVGEAMFKASVSGTWDNDSRSWGLVSTNDATSMSGATYWYFAVYHVGQISSSGYQEFRIRNQDGNKARYWGITQGHGASGNTYRINEFKIDQGRSPLHLDISTDSPSSYLPAGGNDALGGVTRGNFCLGNFRDCGSIEPKWYSRHNGTYWSNGNKDQTAYGTFELASGKWYWECHLIKGKQLFNEGGSANTGGHSDCFGIASNFKRPDGETGMEDDRNNYYLQTNHGVDSGGSLPAYLYHNDTTLITNWPDAQYKGDTIGIAFDADTGKLWFSINGTWLNDGSGNTGNPATGAYPAVTVNSSYAPYVPVWGGRNDDTEHDKFEAFFNFGDKAYRTAAPTGFKTLCDTNLAEPATGPKGSKYFDAVRYTGDGSASQSVSLSNSENTPAIVLIKHESGSGSDWVIQDTVRGWDGTKKLSTSSPKSQNVVDAGATDPKWGYVDAVGAGSFTLNVSTGGGNQVNKNTEGFIAFVWGGGAAAGSDNTNGSTTVTAANQWVNNTAGFSISKYSGGSGSTTVGHGLTTVPSMVWVKALTGSDQHWTVYHKSLDTGDYLRLNDDSAAIDYAMFDDSHPTSTVVPLGNDDQTSGSGRDYIMYAFSAVPGFSAFGEYEGSGHAFHGAFANCGFRPKMMFVKCTTAASQEWILTSTENDSAGEAGNPLDRYLMIHNSLGSHTGRDCAYFSTGAQQIHGSSGATNDDGKKYIWAAWAEVPFKYARGF